MGDWATYGFFAGFIFFVGYNIYRESQIDMDKKRESQAMLYMFLATSTYYLILWLIFDSPA